MRVPPVPTVKKRNTTWTTSCCTPLRTTYIAHYCSLTCSMWRYAEQRLLAVSLWTCYIFAKSEFQFLLVIQSCMECRMDIRQSSSSCDFGRQQGRCQLDEWRCGGRGNRAQLTLGTWVVSFILESTNALLL